MRAPGILGVAAAAVAIAAAPGGGWSHVDGALHPCEQHSEDDTHADCCDERYEECEPHGDVFPE